MKEMKKILCYAGLSDGPAYYRSLLPVRYLGDELLAKHDIQLDLAGNIAKVNPGEADALLVHRVFMEPALVHFARLKYHGTRILWDTDDACDVIPKWSNVQYDPSTVALYEAIQGLADMKLVSTEPLAERVGTNWVLPNLIDPKPFDAIPFKELPPARPVNIFWYGSATHFGDLELIEEPLRRILGKYGSKVKLTLWGESLPSLVREFFGKNLRTVEPVVLGDFMGRLRMSQPDICLAPLVDHPFNRCKSNIKWLESTLSGAAVVASELEPYQCITDGVTGALCSNEQQWFDTLCALIEDSEGRKTIARQANEVVRSHWTWTGPGRQAWIDALLEWSK